MKLLRTAWIRVAPAFVALLVSGCALLDKAPSINTRYFSPERALEPLRAAPSNPTTTPGTLELRLGRVTSTSYLDERLVYRDSDLESGYYLERRWTEAPEEYLRRRLARVLFEERKVRQVLGFPALTLDVELTAFEEVRAPTHLARMQVIAHLHDERAVRWAETLRIDQPIVAARGSDMADAAVEALALALSTLVDRIADRVVMELAAAPAAPAAGDLPPPPPPPPPPPRPAAPR